MGTPLLWLIPPWYAQLIEDEPLISVHSDELCHYVICAEDDVVEVLAEREPRVILKD